MVSMVSRMPVQRQQHGGPASQEDVDTGMR